jgi:hypothetical protein
MSIFNGIHTSHIPPAGETTPGITATASKQTTNKPRISNNNNRTNETN